MGMFGLSWSSIGFGVGAGVIAGATGGIGLAALGAGAWTAAGVGLGIGALQGTMTGAQLDQQEDAQTTAIQNARRSAEKAQAREVAGAKIQLRAANNNLGGSKMSLARAKRAYHAANIVAASGGEHVSLKDAREMRPMGKPVLI